MTPYFKRVDFKKDLNIFMEIREQADREIIGNCADNKQALLDYLRKNLQEFGKDAFWHIYVEKELIGQLELGCKEGDGYVYLFYLFPKFRNLGYFKHMHKKMIKIMRKKGFNRVRLATTQTNNKAIEVYKHYNWICYGFDLSKPEMLSFHLII